MSMLNTHYDILIIGAGMAGIGVAQHVKTKLPTKSFAIIEARDRLGGTWDFFKYPGLRSDVDMHLYGFSFKPWTAGIGVASADNIMRYLNEAVEEEGLRDHIEFGHRMVGANFDTDSALWTVTLDGADGQQTVTCNWLQMCGGYYSYESGYRPDFPGEETFVGDIIHPQEWPENYDVSGKRIIIIGSGATAVTLLPELVKTAAHVTQLQRSPTYVFAGPREPKLTKALRALLPQPLAYRAVRKKDLFIDEQRHRITNDEPEKLKDMVRQAAMEHLPADFDYDTHFMPRYEPKQQRVCFAPDGDFFQALASDKADIVTDHIDRFTPTGIALTSGEQLEADLIITATGLQMQMFSGGAISVDGREVAPPDCWMYKGIMFSGVPNFAITVGSLVHSYILRVELIAEWICRVITHMDARKMDVAMPTLPKPASEMEALPFTTDFVSGYVQRATPDFPKTTSEEPWVNQQAYKDSVRVYGQPIEDGHMKFSVAN